MLPGFEIFSLVLFCVFTPIYILGTILFVLRRKIEPIQSRSWHLVCISLFFGYLSFANSTLSNFICHHVRVSCMITLWASMLLIPLWALPYFIRAYILYFNYSWRIQSIENYSKIENSWWYPFQRKYATLIGSLVYIGITVLVLIGTGVVLHFASYDQSTFYYLETPSCVLPDHAVIVYIEGVVTGIFIFISIILLFRVRDPFFIKKELAIFLFGAFPTLVCWAVTRDEFFQKMDFPSEIFAYLLYCYSFAISLGIPLYVSYKKPTSTSMDSETKTRMISMSLATGDLFQLTLDTPVLLQSLQKFMVEHWNVENLLFILDLRKFDLLYINDEVQLKEAKRLWNLYIAQDSMFEINIDSSIRHQIASALDSEKIDSTLFEEVKKVVIIQMKEDSFLRWKASSSFETALALYETTLREAV